jgi:hypothetical protein
VKFPLAFYAAWRAKGVFEQNRQWSGYKPDGTPVITCWREVHVEGEPEVATDPETGRLLYVAPGGDWIKKVKGKVFLSIVAECITQDKVAEVIMLMGTRSDTEAHSVAGCAIDPDNYFIRFTSVDDEGNITGYFLTKDMK